MVDGVRFEAVYARYASSVFRYCAYSAGTKAAAEDITAETFARFLQKGERVADPHVEAWLIRVARNLCSNHHRVASRFTTLPDGPPGAADAWTHPDAWSYVARLAEAERLVIYLRVVEDRPFADVARALGQGRPRGDQDPRAAAGPSGVPAARCGRVTAAARCGRVTAAATFSERRALTRDPCAL